MGIAKSPQSPQLQLMTDTTSIKEFFTNEEWDAIYEAMSEFQDHGDYESDLTDSVQSKISKLFLN
jgi:hypothetical protein